MASKKTIFAVASNGGHLIQLLRLKPAFPDIQTVYISTASHAPSLIQENRYLRVNDCNFDKKGQLIIAFFQLSKHFVKYRPSYIITTGAAPGLLAIFLGRLIGAKCIWIDSIANSEEFSFAGKIAKRLTPHWYSQWETVANKAGAKYMGSVL